MTICIGDALRRTMMAATALTVLSAGAAIASDDPLGARLDTLLGQAREGAEVTLSARDALPPRPSERGVATEADLEALIAFSETEAGRVLNRAVFRAFDQRYSEISRALGIAAARYLTTEAL